MKNYYKVRLGKNAAHIDECLKNSFIGVNYGMDIDFTGHFTENYRDFNKKYIPVYLEKFPDDSKPVAGLACGAIWVIGKGINIGDIILSPDSAGNCLVGEVTGEYIYSLGSTLLHRRNVKWYSEKIDRSLMSPSLILSINPGLTVTNLTKYVEEIESLISGKTPAILLSTDDTVEDPSVFALEKHLEDFLVKNWKQTDLGKEYDILEEDGDLIGQQYPSDTGPIDILAISKDKKELLVIELKKGRASDTVVGQIQRYMGYVLDELAEKDQTVRGVIIALEDDIKIRRALAVAQNIDFYRYQVSFKLFKNETSKA